MDDRLLKRASSGDGDALAGLYDRHATRVFRTALLTTGNREDAKDVTQEVFLRLLKGAGKIRDGSALKAWLYRVTINSSIDLIKRRKRHLPEDTAAEPADRRSPETRLAETEDRRSLIEALSKLPEKQRIALVLRFFEDMGIEEISKTLGLTPGSTRVTLTRALNRLRRRLSRKRGWTDVPLLRLDEETN